ncbi:uncharacterized protein K452DRAFT_42930 [Aplosporella prunicola CBS 121167]|uniref:Plasmid pRiA4b Orf3-like domain-containing protein n=1 Tax=Aplosporella prunicola CBS 121167 TaxID=1176127 RepID=A0A6A6BA31_9PEZI|nr:uncharacterized protein K452DRAFT_42930 [Aplosporella prunicola CBS 121167]KAF2140930.1 hypothetical protein K452DRAFT_42930 [Aplosporella prunicola CBS 121167]
MHMYTFDVMPLPGDDPQEMSLFFWRRTLLHMSESGIDYGGDGPHRFPVKKASDYTLRDIYEGEEFNKDKIEVQYEYDMGDGWRHHIVFLGRADPSLRRVMGIPPEVKVMCLGGEGHPVAEDSGGKSGWAALKAVFKRRNRDDRKAWYKEDCGNGDPNGLDPYKWDLLDVNDDLVDVFPPDE